MKEIFIYKNNKSCKPTFHDVWTKSSNEIFNKKTKIIPDYSNNFKLKLYFQLFIPFLRFINMKLINSYVGTNKYYTFQLT